MQEVSLDILLKRKYQKCKRLALEVQLNVNYFIKIYLTLPIKPGCKYVKFTTLMINARGEPWKNLTRI